MKTATQRTEPVQFEMGTVCLTFETCERLSEKEVDQALRRHAVGDWGTLSQHDRDANETALVQGGRLVSSHRSEAGETFWVVTEAHRRVTTVRFPDEY